MVAVSMEALQQNDPMDPLFASVRFASTRKANDVRYLSYAILSTAVARVEQKQRIANQILKELIEYPYYSLVRAGELGLDNDEVHELLHAVCLSHYQRLKIPTPERSRVSFTRVCVNPDSVHTRGQVTRLSRSHLAMPLHTDSSYDPIPHALLLFQAIKTEHQGGITHLMPLDDVLRQLPESVLQTLRTTYCSFGRRDYAILSEESGKPMIRYYREQMQLNGKLEDIANTALEILDKALVNANAQIQFKLQEGDLMFLNNHRILHGRSGFSRSSERLLHRYRVDLPGF